MQKHFSIFFLCACASLLSGQQIAEIIDYTPAPGQFINTASGSPEASLSLTDESGGLVSLGGFGGYIILRLSSPIENDPGNPYGVDFTLFGNALPHWSEPGIVAVMKDTNRNGIPDDKWYELAGSDHFFKGTISNYQISYTNPHSQTSTDIQWTDNQGVSGALLKNNFQHQPYYPDPFTFTAIGDTLCIFEGTRIEPVLDFSNPLQAVSYSRRFGYADNNIRIDPENPLPDDPYSPGSENSGGDGMDISWALDETGQYVELDEIDFIKIYTAVNENGGILGELSTEISLLKDVAPSPAYPITEKLIAVKGLPSKIAPHQYELEYAVFFRGRYMEEETATWSVDCAACSLEENKYLMANTEETIILTVSLDSDPSVFTSFSSQVEQKVETAQFNNRDLRIYPNPARDFLQLDVGLSGTFQFISSNGQIAWEDRIDRGKNILDTGRLSSGIYVLKIQTNSGIAHHKIIIQR